MLGAGGLHRVDSAGTLVESVPALGEVADAVGEQPPVRPSRLNHCGADEVPEKSRFSCAVGADQRDSFRSLDRDDAVAVVQFREAAAARYAGVGHDEVDVLFLAHARLGSVDGRLRSVHSVVEGGAHSSGGSFCLVCARPREDFRDAAAVLSFLGGALLAGDFGFRLHTLTLFTLQCLRERACRRPIRSSGIGELWRIS